MRGHKGHRVMRDHKGHRAVEEPASEYRRKHARAGPNKDIPWPDLHKNSRARWRSLWREDLKNRNHTNTEVKKQ